MAIAGAIGPIVSGVTGYMQSQYQADVAKMNAGVAAINASRARQRSEIEAEDNDLQTSALLGEQEVSQAASGVSLAGKSQIATRMSARKLGRRDTLNIIHAGNVERYNYLVQRANFKAEQEAAKMSGTASLIGGIAGAAGSIGGSLAGSSTSTGQSGNYPPVPVPKPTLVKSYVTPMLKTKVPAVPVWKPYNRGMY